VGGTEGRGLAPGKGRKTRKSGSIRLKPQGNFFGVRGEKRECTSTTLDRDLGPPEFEGKTFGKSIKPVDAGAQDKGEI